MLDLSSRAHEFVGHKLNLGDTEQTRRSWETGTDLGLLQKWT